MRYIPLKKLFSTFVLFTYVFGGSSSFATTTEALLQSLKEVEDFSHYSARPTQTASREEALML